jgi:hypothetical protein
MFDTPNGQRFLGTLSKLAMAAEDIADALAVRGNTATLEKLSWTKRDQLAWELFKQDVSGLDITDGRPMEAQAEYNKVISSAYSIADIFLAFKTTASKKG